MELLQTALPQIQTLVSKDRSVSVTKEEQSTAGESSKLFRLPSLGPNQIIGPPRLKQSQSQRLLRRRRFHKLTQDLRARQGLQNQTSLFGQMQTAFKCLTSL